MNYLLSCFAEQNFPSIYSTYNNILQKNRFTNISPSDKHQPLLTLSNFMSCKQYIPFIFYFLPLSFFDGKPQYWWWTKTIPPTYRAEMPASSSAVATCRTTPESIPAVMIHAPVVCAAFNKPSRKTRPNLSCTLNRFFLEHCIKKFIITSGIIDIFSRGFHRLYLCQQHENPPSKHWQHNLICWQ